MKIGNRIRILRKINNVTLDELAKYIGVSVPTLRKMENNELFINLEITNLIARLLNNDELKNLYYNQCLEKNVTVKAKGEKVYIFIPKDISIAFGLEENQEIYCCFLNKKVILQHQETDDYEFEKRKILKDQYSYIFFLGQKLKYLQGKKVKIALDLSKNILKILY
ncbi:helix-turn-helix domain-containing protein [Fusobacterium sp. SYSU M8A802]